jgi:FG-GAP-like repeat
MIRSSRLWSVWIVVVSLSSAAEAQTYTGLIRHNDQSMPVVGIGPEFNCTVQGSFPVHYHTYSFAPAISGQYRLLITETGSQGSLYVHSETFNPAGGLLTCLAGDSQNRGLSIPLSNARQYVLVPFQDSFDQQMTLKYTLTVTGPFQPPLVDFSRKGQSDYLTVRNTGGGPAGTVTWFLSNSLTGGISATPWGIATDFFVPGDYDGDGKADHAIWRSGASGTAGFWVRRSSDGGTEFIQFGQTGDEPTIVGDYDGDGTTDAAVYHPGASPGQPSVFYYRRSTNGSLGVGLWGLHGDTPVPGDYDGDGRWDLAVRRPEGGAGVFYINRSSTGTLEAHTLGTSTDLLMPGDYDGDGKTDLATLRGVGGAILWTVRRSSDGVTFTENFGLAATDFPLGGDYDRDGKSDFAVWRNGTFWVLKSTGGVLTKNWGQGGDYPVANFFAR